MLPVWVAYSFVGIAACLGAVAGCGGDVGIPSSHAYRLDDVRGAFRGVGLGDPESRIVARFGPDQGKPAGEIAPLGIDSFDSGSPGGFASGPGHPNRYDREAALRYRGMAFVTNNRRVYVIMSSLRGTRTSRGVGVGDKLDAAKRAYRALSCHTATDAHGSDVFPYCSGRLRRGCFIYFGGDPIGTVAVARVPLYG